MIRRLGLLLAGVCALLLSGCSQQLSWPDQVETGAPGAVTLSTGSTIGQTFVALEAGLDGVDIYLLPQGPLDGPIQLVLQPAPKTPGAGATLATANLPAGQVIEPGYYHFAFAPQPDSRLRSYYLRVDYAGPGQVLIGHGPPESYSQGALYRNDGPDDGAQMAFRLAYDPLQVATDLARQGLIWLGWLALAALLFVLPGWALVVWLWPSPSQLSWGEQLGLAIGLSLSLYPILFLLTSLVGLRLGWLYAAMPVGGGALALGVWAVRRWRNGDLATGRLNPHSGQWAPDLAFVGLTILIILTRFWTVRSLVIPLWGDSYQHTVITQLLIDHGGLFSSWAPYANLQSFTYHFGFHTLAAVFHWLSGLDTPSAVLWFGQILNVLAVLTLYPLVVRASGKRWAGVGAVLVAGLLAPMPMAYVNWGRYTQLAGQAILPAAVVLAWAYFDGRTAKNWRLLVLSWVAWGGLALSHYRILIFAILFTVAYWLVAVLARRGKAQLWRTVWLGSGAGLIFLPWFIRTFAGGITSGFLKQLTTPAAETSVFTQQYNSLGDLSAYLPIWLWIAMAAAFGWSLWRRERALALLGIWWGLLLLAADPQWLGLPGEGAISNFALLIAAYLPAGVLVGAALGWLREAAGTRRVWDLSFLAVLLAIAVLGARQRLADVHASQSALVTFPDLRAAAWIENNLGPDARFLVNSFSAYGAATVVGADAGWWLPLLAHRPTNLPPLNYGVESGPRPDYRLWTNALPAEIKARGINDRDVLNALADRGITYVYLGQLRGGVNNPGDALLSAGQLATSGSYRLVYHQDRVWVFQVTH